MYMSDVFYGQISENEFLQCSEGIFFRKGLIGYFVIFFFSQIRFYLFKLLLWKFDKRRSERGFKRCGNWYVFSPGQHQRYGSKSFMR